MSSGSSGWFGSYQESYEDEFGANPQNSLQTEESSNKSCVLFLIDCNKTMFDTLPTDDDDEEEEKRTAFTEVIRATTNVIKDTIINAKSDQLGVVFFCADKSQNSSSMDGIHVFKPLQEPGADLVKDLQALQSKQEFDKLIGSGAPDKCLFSDVLYQCAQVYQEGPKANAFKRIFVFTNRNDPTMGSAAQKEAVKTRTRDLDDTGVELELFPLNEDFDPFKFWADIVTVAEDEDPKAQFLDGFEALEQRIRKREYKKRALGSVPLTIGDNKIGVKMYCMLKQAKKDSPVWLEASTNTKLQCQTSWLCAATGRVLEDHEMKKYHLYGGEKVFFTKDEMGQIKDFGPPGLTLMGFKGMKKLKPYHNIKQPYFIYPDEASIKGSNVAFNALLKACINKNKFAVCRMIYRQRGIPRFVALLPQEESDDPDDPKPAGFHMIFLPYADDVRNLKFEPAPVAPDDAVLKAKALVKKLRINFDANTFENPALQKHYAVLEALALDEEAPEETEDVLVPNYEAFEKYQELFDSFKTEVFGAADASMSEEDSDDSDDMGSSRKRKRAPAKRAPKRVKPSASDIDWSTKKSEAALKKLTVPVLKGYLKDNKVKVTGRARKADLIELVMEHMGI